MAAETFEKLKTEEMIQLFSGKEKSRVEHEVTLPEYKMSAHRILRVDASSRINRKSVYSQKDVLVCEVEGVTTFQILYLPERIEQDKNIPEFFLTQENFSHCFHIPAAQDSYSEDSLAAILECSCENLSYKLHSPRRIAIRTEIELELDLRANRYFSYYGADLDEDMITKTKDLTLTRIASCTQEEWNFSQTLSLSPEDPAIAEIAEMNVELFASSVRPEKEGVSFRMMCDVKCSYLASDTRELLSFCQPIEAEKYVALPDCHENCNVRIQLNPNFLKASSEVDENGEMKRIPVEIGCTAEIMVLENNTVAVLEDAFSLACETICKSTTEKVECFSGEKSFSSVYKETLREEEACLRIEAIRSRVRYKDSYLEDGNIILEGKLELSYLAVKEEGEIVNREKTHDFVLKITPDRDFVVREDCESRIEVCGGVRKMQLTPIGGGLELACELFGSVSMYTVDRAERIDLITRGAKREKGEEGILFLYPEKKSTLWELCKSNCISPDAVLRENRMEGDTIPRVIKVTVGGET